jgi:hypothetical protein
MPIFMEFSASSFCGMAGLNAQLTRLGFDFGHAIQLRPRQKLVLRYSEATPRRES